MATCDNEDGTIELLDECPICNWHALEPHCSANPADKDYSKTCDIVRCQRCKLAGSIDGRWWPKIMLIIDDVVTFDDDYEDELP